MLNFIYENIIVRCTIPLIGISHYCSLLVQMWFYSIPDEMSSNINVLKDMIDIRDGMKECAPLSVNDVNDIIDEIYLNWMECMFKFNVYFLKCLFVRNKDIIVTIQFYIYNQWFSEYQLYDSSTLPI